MSAEVGMMGPEGYGYQLELHSTSAGATGQELIEGLKRQGLTVSRRVQALLTCRSFVPTSGKSYSCRVLVGLRLGESSAYTEARIRALAHDALDVPDRQAAGLEGAVLALGAYATHREDQGNALPTRMIVLQRTPRDPRGFQCLLAYEECESQTWVRASEGPPIERFSACDAFSFVFPPA